MRTVSLPDRLRARANHFATRDASPDTTERLLRAAADEIEALTARLELRSGERSPSSAGDLADETRRLRRVALDRLGKITDMQVALVAARDLLTTMAAARALHAATIPVDPHVVELIESVLGQPSRNREA